MGLSLERSGHGIISEFSDSLRQHPKSGITVLTQLVRSCLQTREDRGVGVREQAGDRRKLSRRAITAATTLAATSAVFFGAAVPAWAADTVTLTFIRHAESFGNIPGATLNTLVPGPNLTPVGVQQALDIAPGLALAGFDGIYYSDMVRTLETAEPLIALEPDLETGMYGGFREISAGIFEGVPIDEGLGRIGYFLIPLTWGLGLRSIPIPLGEGGNEFQDRYSGAVAAVLATGDINPVIFSHGAAIMVWTAMNVDNPDIGMLLANPLGNTEEVVLTGNEEDGWMMQSYAGMPVSQDPGLFTQLFVNARDLIVAPQTAVYNVVQAIGTFNLQNILVAVVDGVVSVVRAGVDFVVNSVTDIVNAIIGVLPGAAESTPSVTAVSVKPVTAAAEVPAATEPDAVSIADADTAAVRSDDAARISARSKARTAAAADPATASDDDTAAPPKAAAESSWRAGSSGSDESDAGSADAPAKASSSTRRAAEKAAA